MIREIFDILNAKYQATPNNFELTFRRKIRVFITDFSIKDQGF